MVFSLRSALISSLAGLASGDCFLRLSEPLKEPPFSEVEESALWDLFEANINVNGTGAVIASPGACPALVECCNILEKMPYGFHWTRDASLSLLTLLQHLSAPGKMENKSDVEPSFLQTAAHNRRHALRRDVEKSIDAFATWVSRSHERTQPAGNVQVNDAAEEAFLEPKWTFDGEPYKGGWCRPQTDGPALRARLMMRAAKIFPDLAPKLIDLAKKDLEWLVLNHRIESCDLWEETRDKDFLWNRVVQLAALAEGHHLDLEVWQKEKVLQAIHEKGATLTNHLAGPAGEEYLTNCPATQQSDDCVRYNKTLDGVLILTLIHGHPVVETDLFQMPGFTDNYVANTVKELSKVFCGSYPVNRQDSDEGVPGVLLGRYEMDKYGHLSQGNPWVLITASLANLFYQAAAEVKKGKVADAKVWAKVFKNGGNFTGSAEDFVAAGDSVLVRIKHHMNEGMHLFEQIDKHTGKQYNAEDLTWSYSEVLDALHQRREALKA